MKQKKAGVKQWIPPTHEFWFKLKNQLNGLIQTLAVTSFVENMIEAKEAGDFFRTANDQFPDHGDGFRASIHLHVYMASLNLKIFQFQQSRDFLKAASQLLKDRVTQEEEQKNAKNKQFNLRSYATILMLKADRSLKMHDHELAYKAMYKAYRAIRATDIFEAKLLIQWYEVMAKLNISQKESMQANEYLLKARKMQLELG